MSNMKLVNGVLTEMTAAEITQRELDIAAHAADRAANGYKTDRAAAYPSIADQLDKYTMRVLMRGSPPFLQLKRSTQSHEPD
jgi:hypothetical protein